MASERGVTGRDGGTLVAFRSNYAGGLPVEMNQRGILRERAGPPCVYRRYVRKFRTCDNDRVIARDRSRRIVRHSAAAFPRVRRFFSRWTGKKDGKETSVTPAPTARFARNAIWRKLPVT